MVDVTDTADPEYNGKVGAKSIKSETYLFNNRGVMLSGLYWLGDTDEGGISEPVYKGTSVESMEPGYYCFNIDGSHGSTEGQMVTNKRVKIDVHDEDEYYYFRKDGRAYTNTIISGSIYGEDGRLVNDYGDGSTYQIVEFWGDIYKKGSNTIEIPEFTDGERTKVLINENGKIKKSGKVTDMDDQKITVSNYVVQTIEADD